jgi:hypothetical protein
MQENKTIDDVSHGEVAHETKAVSEKNAVSLHHFEDAPEPHLHLKTFLIVAVSLCCLLDLIRIGPLTRMPQAVSLYSFATFMQLVFTGVVR